MILGVQRKSVSNNSRLDIVVEQHRYERILETRHYHNIVYKLIFRATHLAQAFANISHIFLRIFIDKQHLEIRPWLIMFFVVILAHLTLVFELGRCA